MKSLKEIKPWWVREGYSSDPGAHLTREYARDCETSELRAYAEQLERERDESQQDKQQLETYQLELLERAQVLERERDALKQRLEVSEAQAADLRQALSQRLSPQPVGAVVAFEKAAQACNQQADGTNGAYRSACLQCADAVRELRDAALAAQTPAQQGVIDANTRVSAYIQRRKKARGLDIESIHGFDVSPTEGVELLLSDLETLLAAAPSPEAQEIGKCAGQGKTCRAEENAQGE